MKSGELLNQLNKNINKKHHEKPQADTSQNKTEFIQQPQKHQLKQSEPKQQITQKQVKSSEKQQKKQMTKQPESIDQSRQYRQKTQSQTNSSHISRVEALKKKATFKQSHLKSGMIIQEQEIGQNLTQILANQIGKLISQPLAEVIESTMRLRQKNAYVIYTNKQTSYLQVLLQTETKKDEESIKSIQNLLMRRQNKTMQKLEEGSIFIDRQKSIQTKDHLQMMHKLDVQRLIKIKDGTIRSKVDLLNDKMMELQNLHGSRSERQSLQKQKMHQLNEKIHENIDPSNFSLNSQKTKIANDYVKYMQQQRLLLMKKVKERQQKRNQIDQQRKQQLKQAQQMRDLAKKQQIQQRIQQLKRKRIEQNKNTDEQMKKIQIFLSQYKKKLPLYRKKQKQFKERYLNPKEKQRSQKLKQIRQERKSMSLSDINNHDQKYMKKLSMDIAKRQQEFKMMINARKANDSLKPHFKGFFHQKVQLIDKEQKLKFYSLREATRVKMQRMSEYEKLIKKQHKPNIDKKKQEDLIKKIQIDELKKKKVKKLYKQVQSQNGEVKIEPYYQVLPQVDHKKKGNQYMEIAKMMAAKKQHRSNENFTQDQGLQIDLDESSINYPDQRSLLLKQAEDTSVIAQQKNIWRLRGKQLNQQTENVDAQSFDQVKKNLQKMDDMAKKKQSLLKFKEQDYHQNMQQKGILDNYYLQSIKNKMKMLNQ